jgi:hypothetical protein
MAEVGCDDKSFARTEEPEAIVILEGWVHKLLTDASSVALPSSTSALQAGTAVNCVQSGAAWLSAVLKIQVRVMATPEKMRPELHCRTEAARRWKVPRQKREPCAEQMHHTHCQWVAQLV